MGHLGLPILRGALRERVEQTLACGSVARLSQLNTHVVQNSLNCVSSTSLTSSRSVALAVALVAHRVLASLDLERTGVGGGGAARRRRRAVHRAVAGDGARPRAGAARRGRGAAGAGLRARVGAPLHEFMARFKMAATMDERGAEPAAVVALVHADDQLVDPAGVGRRALGATLSPSARRRARRRRPELLNVTDGGFVAAPKRRAAAAAAAATAVASNATRASRRCEKLYGLGGDGGGGGGRASRPPPTCGRRRTTCGRRRRRPPVARSSADERSRRRARDLGAAMSDELGPPGALRRRRRRPARRRRADAASPQASQKWTPRAVGGLNDDWEDEVDDLLKFTQGLDADLL